MARRKMPSARYPGSARILRAVADILPGTFPEGLQLPQRSSTYPFAFLRSEFGVRQDAEPSTLEARAPRCSFRQIP